MRKQVLLISVLVLVVGSSAVMLSRQAESSAGKFALDSAKATADVHHTKAQDYAAAAKWRIDRLKDENGNFYPSYVMNAMRQANSYQSLSRSNGLGLQWQELGPDDVGGRTRAILIDKRDTTNNTIYAGGVSGGLWKSTDGANTWTRLSSFDNWVGISCIAQAPAPDYSIYVGTGPGWDGVGEEGSSFTSARYGNGIFKINSSDSGVLVTPDLTAGFDPGNGQPWYIINRIGVNPNNANEVYATTLVGLWKSENAGATWSQSLFTGSLASLNNTMFGDLKWSSDGKNLYVAYLGGMVYSNNGGVTWKGESASNANFPASVGRIEMAVTPANPEMIYILATTSSNGGCTKGVYKSSNAGLSWQIIEVGGPLFQLFEEGGGNACQGEYDNAIALSPTDTDKFYMGGVNFYTGSGASGVQPADYGYSNESNPFYMHPDKHTIVIADNNPDLMYVGCDGGIFKSTNAHSSFPNPTYTAQNRGYNVTQNYGIGAGLDGSVIGGTQDNGTNYINYYGNSFGASTQALGGDGFLNYVSTIDQNFYFGAIYYAALYRSSTHASTFGGYFDVKVDPLGQGGATVCGQQYAQEDAQFCTPYYLGETKNALNGSLKVQYTAADRTHYPGEVISIASAVAKAPFDITLSDTVQMDSTILVDDPFRSRIIMSAQCGVFLTSDALNIAIIPRWFQLTNSGFVGGGQAQTFVTTSDGDNLYMGTDNGYVYRYSNFNIHSDSCKYPAAAALGILYPVGHLNDVQSAPVAPGRSIEGIDVDATDNNHLVAVVAGFSASNQPHVYESHDGGLTWVADTAGLPNMPVYTVVIHSPTQFIIGTEFGIWSWDGGRWHEDNGNFERVPVYRIIERNLYAEGCKVLYAGSHGRGMWRCTTLTSASCNTAVGTAVNNVKPNAITGLNVFPNPVHNSAKISLNIDNSDNVTIRIFDLTGKVYSEKSYQNVPAGTNLFDLDASGLSSGSYLVAATVADTRTLSRLFIVAK